MPELEEELARAGEVLRGAARVAIACHVNPDTDALGSMLGLANHLTASTGAEVVCAFPNEPQELPRWAALLPGTERLVPVADYPSSPEVMVTCDCASFDRLGALGEPASRAAELIWVDHHRSNDGVGTIRVVDPDASSTCELVVRLIDAIGGELEGDAAICLYAGLVTDTGRFQYEAATPETLRVAARLRAFDFDHARLSQALYEDHARSYLALTATALRRLSHDPDADLVWTYVTQSDLVESGIAASDTEDLIDVIRSARDVDVAALVKQQPDGRFKVSVRSRGRHDLSVVASAFGGGGHRLAAGYTSEHGPAGTIERLVAALRGEPVAP
jgi:phosphoesterase RecJ-like protein